jgi:hypothetical protein
MVYDLSAIYFAVAGFGTSSGATSVGCRLSRCPLLVEFGAVNLWTRLLRLLVAKGWLSFDGPRNHLCKDSCTRRRNPACSGTARIRLFIRRSLFRQDRSSKRRNRVWNRTHTFINARARLRPTSSRSLTLQSYRTVKSPYGDLRRAGIIIRKFNDAAR